MPRSRRLEIKTGHPLSLAIGPAHKSDVSKNVCVIETFSRRTKLRICRATFSAFQSYVLVSGITYTGQRIWLRSASSLVLKVRREQRNFSVGSNSIILKRTRSAPPISQSSSMMNRMWQRESGLVPAVLCGGASLSGPEVAVSGDTAKLLIALDIYLGLCVSFPRRSGWVQQR